MQLDRFTIPDNQSYIWKLNSYQLSHRIMQLWLEPEDPISKAKRFRMTFLSVEYFEGTTTWIAASFRKGTYNEWVDVWHRMGKIIVPYSPNYLYRIFDVFSLYTVIAS